MPGGELAAYAELFKENHITGKRLFLVTMDDLLQIGMFSVGHRRELLVGGPLGALREVCEGAPCETGVRHGMWYQWCVVECIPHSVAKFLNQCLHTYIFHE